MRIFMLVLLVWSGLGVPKGYTQKTSKNVRKPILQKKKKKRFYKRTRRAKKAPPITREAAKEVQNWLAPLSRTQSPQSGMKAIVEILRIWIASRWGLRLRPKAWKQWLEARTALRLWNPAPFYRKMRGRWNKTRLFAKLIQFKYLFTVPKQPHVLPTSKRRAVMGVRVKRLRRMHFQKRRPYRFSLLSFADIPPVHVHQIDQLVKAMIVRATSSQLNVQLPTQQRLFPWLKGEHSRRVADWVTTRFPKTAYLLDRYLVIKSIMEPMGHGHYRFDFQARWHLPALRKDYPRLYRRMLKRHKNKAYVEVVFFGKKKRRRFLKWSYNRQTMVHRFQAVLSRGGFMLCTKQWAPIAGPWRPTKMGVDWYTHARFWMRSKRFRVSVSQAWLKWRVRKTPKGGSLTMELVKKPRFKVKGGEFLRLLAKMVISGGVERLVNRFLDTMTRGDEGRGFRLQWEAEDVAARTRVHFRMIMPMMPNRTLTSILRILPSLRRRSRRASKKNTRKRRKARRRRRRRLPPLWYRLYTTIFSDIESARNLLAQK